MHNQDLNRDTGVETMTLAVLACGICFGSVCVEEYLKFPETPQDTNYHTVTVLVCLKATSATYIYIPREGE